MADFWNPTRLLSVFIIIVAPIGFARGARAQVIHERKIVTAIRRDDRPCIFFSLASVVQADPVVPGSPVFAIDRNALNSTDLLSMLMSAQYAKAPLFVETSGDVVCGHARVSAIATRD